MSGELDQRVRLAAFQWLRAQMDVHGEVLPRALLADGFILDGRRVLFWLEITDHDWFRSWQQGQSYRR